MSIKKAIFIFLLCGYLHPINLLAQNPTLDSVNLQLRQLFVNLSRPSNPKHFLYDMSGHLTDSSFYRVNSADTATSDIWYKIYEEMYHSAYDTTTLTHPEIIFENSQKFRGDTIPIGIINYSFYLLKNDALTTNTYFSFDTVNTILTDKNPRPDYPYLESTIFTVSPLKNASKFANPIFRIDPQFILFDNFNVQHFQNSSYIMQINFDDGLGWRNINPTTITHIQVNYTTIGEKVIKCRINFNGEVAISSNSRLINPTTSIRTTPSFFMNQPGINVAVYLGCNQTAITGKSIIYLSGIDLTETTTLESMYELVLQKNRIVQLRNLGYKLLIVDWKNSRIDMRYNALYLVNLLQELKAQITDGGEQFVIIGESMGGVIARYALTYMESQAFQNKDVSNFFSTANDINNIAYLAMNPKIYDLPYNWDNLNRMHLTRLFISMDAPQQGANIPISLQKAYRFAIPQWVPFMGSSFKKMAELTNLFLDGQAAQQLLIYHQDTEFGSGFYKKYSRHEDAESFFGQLAEMGSYPQFAKVILMSNGAMNGERQTNPFIEEKREPNDKLIGLNVDLFMRVLGLKIPMFGGNITARTNPDGQGEVLNANAGKFSVRIKLRLFGIKIYADYNSIINLHYYADTKPYCTSSGSFEGEFLEAPNLFSQNFGITSSWFLDIFHTNFQYTSGCLNFGSHIRVGALASANSDISICSDGMHFCFVPTQSALDYGTLGNNPTLDFNIEHNRNINEKLATTNPRVDMLIGRISRNDGIYTNGPHVSLRNDVINNINNTDTTYFSCMGTSAATSRGFLNMEIGDEELYLENNTLNWAATYSAEYDLHINERNPRYEYPSQPFTFNTLPTIYSRDNDFNISSNGFATFVYDQTNSPTGVGFNFVNQSGSYTQLNQPLGNCCQNYLISKVANIKPFKNKIISKLFNGNLQLFPNPNNGNSVTLKYQFAKTSSKIQLAVFNGVGQKVLQKNITNFGTGIITTILPLNQLALKQGTYYITLSNGMQTLSSKLLITTL